MQPLTFLTCLSSLEASFDLLRTLFPLRQKIQRMLNDLAHQITSYLSIPFSQIWRALLFYILKVLLFINSIISPYTRYSHNCKKIYFRDLQRTRALSFKIFPYLFLNWLICLSTWELVETILSAVTVKLEIYFRIFFSHHTEPVAVQRICFGRKSLQIIPVWK